MHLALKVAKDSLIQQVYMQEAADSHSPPHRRFCVRQTEGA